MKRMALVAVTVLIGTLVFGLSSIAGADDYPPNANAVAVVGDKSAQVSVSPAAVQADPLPRTGGNSARLVWTGGALLVAGAVLVGARRRAVRR